MVQSVEKHSPSESSSRAKLGEILVDQGRLTRIDLDDSLSDQQQSGDRLGQILLRKGRIGHADLVQALAQQASVPTVDLEHQHVAGTALSCVPPELAIKHKVLPFSMDNGSLSVAMSDPFDRAALDAVRTLSGRRVRQLDQQLAIRGVFGEAATDPSWDGLDDGGRRVAPGLYLYRIALEADEADEETLGIISVVY